MYKLIAKNPDTNLWVQLETLTESLPINKQRNDIAELKDRQSDYSQAISLPMIAKNCEFFGYINSFTTVSDLRRRKYDCRLFFDGIEIAGSGSYLKIIRITDYFEVQILGAESLFMSELSEKNINDLNLNEIIVCGIEGQKATRHVIETQLEPKLFYSICDFASEKNAQYSFADNYIISNVYQFPFCTLKYIIDNILLENGGYTLESDVTADNEYRLACLPFENRLPTQIKYIGTQSLESVKQEPILMYKWFDIQSAVNYYSCKFDAKENQVENVTGLIYVDNKNPNIQLFPNDGNSWLFKLTPTTNTVNVTLDLIFRVENNISNVIVKIYLDTDDSYYPPINGVGLTIKDNDGTFKYYNEQIVINETFVGTPSAYRLKAEILCSFIEEKDTYIEPFFIQVKDNAKTNNTLYEVPAVDDYFLSLDLMAKKNLMSISQADFFKTFLQMFGLTIDINEKSKIIRAYTFKKVVDNKENAKDFTYKLQQSKKEVHQLGDYGQNNYIKYTQRENTDNGTYQIFRQASKELATELYNSGKDLIYYEANSTDAVYFNKLNTGIFPDKPQYYCYSKDLKQKNETYVSEGILTVIDETIDKTKDMFSLPFEACEFTRRPIFYPNTHVFNSAKMRWYTSGGGYTATSKIVLYSEYTAPCRIDNPIGQIMELSCWLPFVAPIYKPRTGDTISIEAYDLVKKYYKYYQSNVLNDIRFIEDAEFYLTALDVNEYDCYTPIYLQQYSSYFYINKIKNFIAGKITNVDLIKI